MSHKPREIEDQAAPLNSGVSKSMATTSVKWGRFSLALVIGTAVSAQILAMWHYWNGPRGLTMEVLPATPLLASLYLVFMLPTAFLVGAPFAILLNRIGCFKGWVVLIIGALAGALWAIPSMVNERAFYDTALLFGVGGFVASLVFWVIYAGANKVN
jgi:hypothetical protein